MAGTHRVTIVSKNLTWPNDLAIDHLSKRLFWVDAKHDHLYSVDFDGNNRIHHFEMTFNGGMVHPYSLAYSAKHSRVYYSDWHTDRVYVDLKMDGMNVTSVFNNTGQRKNIGQIRLLEDGEAAITGIVFSSIISNVPLISDVPFNFLSYCK